MLSKVVQRYRNSSNQVYHVFCPINPVIKVSQLTDYVRIIHENYLPYTVMEFYLGPPRPLQILCNALTIW